MMVEAAKIQYLPPAFLGDKSVHQNHGQMSDDAARGASQSQDIQVLCSRRKLHHPQNIVAFPPKERHNRGVHILVRKNFQGADSARKTVSSDARAREAKVRAARMCSPFK
jgi:hypothetical protein